MKQKSNTRVFLVTGATGAIGKAIAWQLAALPGSKVVCVCRDQHKAETLVSELIRQTGNPAVSYELADLSRRQHVNELANRWVGPLHVLINNAATSPRTRKVTPEGIELQFATNVLAYFWLTQAFTEILQASAPARVVNVASYWAGGLDIDDLEFTRRPYRNGAAYRQAKQANRMLTAAFAEQLRPYGITVNACHPGDVNSKLSNDLGFGGHETPDQGAKTPVWLATSAVGEQNTGLYYEHMRESHCPFIIDKRRVAELFDRCAGYE